MKKYQQIAKKIECPVCCSNNAHRLWGVNSKLAAQHFVLKEKEPERFLELVAHLENLWGQNTCEVVRCDNCLFCFSNPYIAGDERFYSLAYGHVGYPTWKWEFQLTYEILKKFSKLDIKLLEIGAGDGAFIRKIVEDGILIKDNISCTEFSEYGKNKIKKFGVKCYSEDVRELSNPELCESFDIVCMFQVLEHMDRLEDLFKKLNWIIKKGGNLFIAVPCEKNIEFNETNGALLDMPPNHIGRWNIKCFEEIGKQNGFVIENYQVEKVSFASGSKQFITYRFLQRSQKSGSFENQIHMIENRYFFKLMKKISFVVNSIIAIPIFVKNKFKFYNSQWVHFIKV